MFKQLCSAVIRHIPNANASLAKSVAQPSVLRGCALFGNVSSSKIATTSTLNAAPLRTFSSLHLNALTDVPTAKREGTRVGRGRSSGVGKTCGRGIKGRGARVGHFGKPRHEGGQSALWRRSPKRGFRNNINRAPLTPVSLQTLVHWVAAGRLDGTKTITMKEIYDSGLSGKIENGVKLLLGNNPSTASRLPMPLNLEVSHCSSGVKEAIENAGGSVKFTHYSTLGLRELLKPGSLNFEVQPSVPKPKKALRFELQTVGIAGRELLLETLQSRIKRKVWKKK